MRFAGWTPICLKKKKKKRCGAHQGMCWPGAKLVSHQCSAYWKKSFICRPGSQPELILWMTSVLYYSLPENVFENHGIFRLWSMNFLFKFSHYNIGAYYRMSLIPVALFSKINKVTLLQKRKKKEKSKNLVWTKWFYSSLWCTILV